MKKIKKLSIVGILIIVLLPASGLQAQNQKSAKEKTPLAELKLKVFEGIREGRVEPIKAVTSSFWQYTLSASIKGEDTSEKEESQLQRVFNLKAVRLLTEANLSWTQIGAKDFHIFQLDNKEYAIIITLVRIDHPEKITGRIEVMEQNGEMKVSLLDSELSLYKNVITTLGFEDKSGQPYFLSLKVQNIRPVGIAVIPIGGEKVEVTPKVPAGGATGGVIGSQSVESLLFIDAVRAIGEIKPPKLIKKVDPVYPEEARKAGVEGIVILEVTTDQFGRVASVRVLKSVPLLDEAAIDAVKQWVYEPVIIDGKPKPIVFTVTVNFQLKEK